MFFKRFILLLIMINIIPSFSVKAQSEKIIALMISNRNAVVNGETSEIPDAAPYVKNDRTMVPVRFVSENLGAEVSFDGRLSIVTLYYGENKIKITLLSDEMLLNNKVVKLDAAAEVFNGRTFIPLRAIGEALGKNIFYDNRGMIIISDSEIDKKADKQLISELYFKLTDEYYYSYNYDEDYIDVKVFQENVHFDIPSREQMLSDFKKNNPNKQHPRIIVRQDRFDYLKEKLLNNEEPYIKWYNNLISRANSVIPQEPAQYEDNDPVRLLAPHSYTWSRTLTLGLAYKLSDDKIYADRLYKELETAAGFPDWNPDSSFLDTAFMTGCFAVGYDWLYDYLNEEQRLLLRTAIVEKGLTEALEDYKTGHDWTKTPDNWAGVCNGGITMACLSIMEENEEIALDNLEYAMEKIIPLLVKPEPDGQNEEGPHYWNYGTGQWFAYMASSLNSALGTDYGYLDKNGIHKTMYYLPYMAGTVNTFRMHDDDGAMNGISTTESLLWSAKRFNDPSLGAYYARYLKQNPSKGDIFELLWYDPEYADADYPVKLLPDKYFRESETITMRSSWTDSNGVFAGFHSGSNNSSHATMNTGTFDFQALGEQWTVQLGRDSYTDPAYFRYDMNYDTDGENMAARYGYYRVRAEGTNTLVINPDHRPDQNWDAFSRMQKIEFKPRGGFGITDMTEAYSRDALKVKRGVMLTHDREWAVVQDEFEMLDPSTVYWFMHTRADVQIADDGKSAVLKIGNKNLWVGLQSPADAKFEIMGAEPLSETVFPLIKNTENVGVRKLMVKLSKAIEGRITVVLVPMTSREIIVPEDLPPVEPLKKWSIPDGPIPPKPPKPFISEILINGEKMEGFMQDKFDYKAGLPFETDKKPEIEVATEHEYEIKQGEGLPDTITIAVTDRNDPQNKSFYYLEAEISPKIGLLDTDKFKEYTIKDIKASSEPQSDHLAIEAADGDMDPESRWSADGVKQWIQFDLGGEVVVDTVSIAWLNGDTRVFKYGIEASKDGENWEEAARSQSTGTTKDYETYRLKSSNARYIRIVGYGNSDNGWISIVEAKVGKKQ